MNCEIFTTPEFNRELKRLAKRYRSMKEDYIQLLDTILKNPLAGTDLGSNLRKIRMPIASKGKGKSGGARVISHAVVYAYDNAKVTLVMIYDKSERETISDKEIKALVKKNNL